VIYVGIDWSQTHHDLCLMDEAGAVLAKRRIADTAEGLTELQALVAQHVAEPAEAVIGIELAQGLLVSGLRAAGYVIYAINPLAVTRYRDRHSSSKAKSDRADAKLLADLVRTDRHNHRELADDSEQAQALKMLARSHKSLIWARQQFVSQLRGLLREYYPALLEAFGKELYAADALAILERAPTPARGRALAVAKISSALGQARRRKLEARAAEIRAILQAPRMEQPALLADAYGASASALARAIKSLNGEISSLESTIAQSFERHPDAEIYLSLPGLGMVLGARALGEFGDDPDRFQDSRARRNYAGTSPITRASGNKMVVVARFVGNDHLADTSQLWAFSALKASPGARRYYDALRARNKSHRKALRALANRLVGILDGCLRSRQTYREDVAWPPVTGERAA
jgi:transposase